MESFPKLLRLLAGFSSGARTGSSKKWSTMIENSSWRKCRRSWMLSCRSFFFGDTVVDGSEIWWSPIDIWYTPPQSLTWNLKKMVSTRNLLFQGAIFRFRVNLQGCIPFIYDGFLAPSNRWSLLFGISEPSTVAQLGRKKNTWFLPLQLGPLPNPFAKRGDFPSMGLSGDASSQVSIVHEWCVNLKKTFIGVWSIKVVQHHALSMSTGTTWGPKKKPYVNRGINCKYVQEVLHQTCTWMIILMG